MLNIILRKVPSHRGEIKGMNRHFYSCKNCSILYGIVDVMTIQIVPNFAPADYKESIMCLKSNRKAMNRNLNNQKANPALKTKTGNE